MTNILLITNRLTFAEELGKMIEQEENNCRVCNIVFSASQAAAWFAENELPDLIITEIELDQSLIFDVFKNLDVVPPVIYCAETDQYTFEAFAASGIGYLLKPIAKSKIQKSLNRFLKFKQVLRMEDTIPLREKGRDLLYENHYKSAILAYHKDKIIPVELDRAQYLYYGNSGVTIHTDNANYETRDTLNNIIAALNPNEFFRANRQFIIHRKAVKSIRQYFGRKLLIGITSDTPEPVVISKANATEFLKWVEGIHLPVHQPVLAKRSA